MKRWGLLVTAWYLMLALGAPFVLLDELAPRSKKVIEADFPCAFHECGCMTAEQCNSHCCCFPNIERARRCCTQPVETPVTALGQLKCRGDLPKLGPAPNLLPHLPMQTRADRQPVRDGSEPDDPFDPPHLLIKAIDKIPIDRSA